MITISRSGGLIVIPDNTTHIRTTRDISIAETIDDTRCTVKKTHKATHIAVATNGTATKTGYLFRILGIIPNDTRWQNATIIDTRSSFRLTTDSTCITIAVATTDIYTFQNDILHRTIIDCGKQRGRKLFNLKKTAIESAREW